MPRLEDIEQFKSDLNALGHEPSILAQRGERLEDVPVPESGLDADLDALLGTAGDDFGNESVPASVAEEPEESIFGVDEGEDQLPPSTQDEEDDFSIPEDLLSGFSLDDEDETSEEGDAASDMGEPEDEFSLPDGLDIPADFASDEPSLEESDEGELSEEADFSNESAADAEDDFSLPEGMDFLEETIADGEEEPLPSAEDDFSLPEGMDFTDETADIPAVDSEGDFSLPDDMDISEEALEESSSEGEDDFGLPEGFDFSDAEEEPVEAAEIESEDEFGLPAGMDFGDESVDEPVAPIEEGEPAEEGDDEFGLPDGFDFPEESESADIPEEDDFSTPEGMDFTEDSAAGADEFEIPEEFADAADLLELDGDADQSASDEAEESFDIPAGLEEEALGDAIEGEDEFSLPDDFSMEDMEETPVGDEISFSDGEMEESTGEAVEEDFSLPGLDEEFSFDDDSIAAPEEGPADGADEELSFFDDEFSSDSGGDEADFSISEDFPFDEPSIPGAAADEGGEFDEFEIPSAGDIEDIDENNFEVDEFSLGDLGEQFGELEETFDVGTEEQLNPALDVSGELPQSDEVLDLEDDEFEALQETLNLQPLNLKIAVEELIGEKNLSGPHLQKLVRALVDGKSSKEIAALVGTITGKKIKIPTRYEKSTGAAFEEEKGTFAYAFRHTILPILRVAALVLVAVGLLGFLSYTFVYRPIHALILYNAGYRQLEQDAYREANLFFDNATEEWRYKNQYFRYAEGFADRRQYSLAGAKYEALAAPVLIRRNGRLEKHPEVDKIRGSERQALLDYAAMETEKTENFEHAEELLDVLLAQERHDRDALLAEGDNYLAWGEYDYQRYEDARHSYSVLMQYYGQKYEYLFRMLRYFIRTDNYKEVTRLKDQFEAAEKLKVEPDAYAELGGYLIGKNDLDDVRGILSRALEEEPELPEGHYNLSRYFRRVDNPVEERKALDYAEHYFEQTTPLGKRQQKLLIDTYNRQGEVDYQDGLYLTAEEYFLTARDQYEDGLERRVLEPEPMFGRIYKNLGDLYYYIAAEFGSAFEMFTQAEKTGYKAPEINYKKGYIYYNNTEYQDALAEFYLAADDYSDNENLLLATGNALFNRSDYYAAQGYYTHLLDELQQERRNISVLLPNEREEDYSLIERLIRTHNNLGVTLQRLSLASGDREKFSRALGHFTDSAENFDLLRREPESMQRGSAVNLGYLNQRAMLYPVENYDLQIYTDIPLDMETLKLQ